MTTDEGFKPPQPSTEVPPSVAPSPGGRLLAAPGAGLALGLLLGINLFNYIDRQVLAAIVADVEIHFLEWFKVTDPALASLRAEKVPEKVPDDVLTKLNSLKNKEFKDLHQFQAELTTVLGPEDRQRFQDQILKKTHFSPPGNWNGFLIGLLNTAFMVTYMIFAPLFGWLADRMRRWWLVGLGVMIWSLASGASGLSSALAGMAGYWLFFMTRCFVGIGEAAYGPVAPAVISDLYPERIRGQVLSYFHAAIPVGSALGYTLGGLAGWPLSFYLVVPPGLLLGLCCFLMREPKRGQTDVVEPHTMRHVTLKDYKKLFRTPSFVLDTAGMTCLTFALGGIAYWMPIYLLQYRDMGETGPVNTTFGIIVVVSGLVATLLGGWVSDWYRKYNPGSYFLVSGIAMMLAFPMFVFLVFAPKAFIWPLIFLACFLLFFNTGPTNTILANVTHPSLRAPAFALNILIIHALGDAISPAVIGFIADLHQIEVHPGTGEGLKRDLNLGFLIVSGMILLGSICWLIGARYLERDTRLAATQLDDEAKPS